MKIAHLASYHVNVGDNITIRNIRRSIEAIAGKQQWRDVPIIDFHEKRNKVSYCVERFIQINRDCDALLVGGGGLIEGGNCNRMSTGWKLPFNKEILEHIKIPIFVHSVGFNYFWGQERLTATGRAELERLVDKAKCFSVRDDGSLEIMEAIVGKNVVDETPDPGMMMDDTLVKVRKPKVKQGYFQPAWNANADITLARFGYKENLSILADYVAEFDMIGMPHTPKDLLFPLHRWSRKLERNQWAKLFHMANFMEAVKDYDKADFVVAMRGHGQIISFDLNVPGIYLVTQPKLKGFSEKANMLDYTVNIRDTDWLQQLLDKTAKIKKCPEYLMTWYERRDMRMAEMRKRYDQFNKKIAAFL